MNEEYNRAVEAAREFAIQPVSERLRALELENVHLKQRIQELEEKAVTNVDEIKNEIQGVEFVVVEAVTDVIEDSGLGKVVQAIPDEIKTLEREIANEINVVSRKFGRQPRSYNPAVPHLSTLSARLNRTDTPVPATCDHTEGMPADFGMMLNDTLGDCTCAAVYHARQIFTFGGRHWEATAADSFVQQLYEKACGYVPGDPATDQGGNEQSVLSYLTREGAPTQWGPDRLQAFFELDPRNHADAQRACYEAGVVYLGIEVPSHIEQAPAVWDVDPADTNIVGGHAIIMIGYNEIGPLIISWGQKYQMTWAFWDKYVDEAYVLIDNAWFSLKGTTFLGQTQAFLDQQMAALKMQVGLIQ